MQDDKPREHGEQADEDREQVICSNKLLAAIRERMAKRRSDPKHKPKEIELDDIE